MKITEEQKEYAVRVDARAFLESKYGLEFKRAGGYFQLASDKSVTFFPPERNKSGIWRYKDFSAEHPSQGDLIAFLTEYCHVSFPDAVFQLSTFAGYRDVKDIKLTPPGVPPRKVKFESIEKEERQLILPKRAGKPSRAIAYLLGRGIDKDILYACIKDGRIFEDAEHHNVVFVGRDRIGIDRYAMLRGTYNFKDATPFKGEASGSDKRYSFCLKSNIKDCEEVVVLEAAIDVLSFATLEKMKGRNYKRHHILSLGCGSDVALMQFLSDHPGIKSIVLSLDNDKGGRAATVSISEKLSRAGYTPIDRPAPSPFKDMNEYLVAVKKTLKKEEVERE